MEQRLVPALRRLKKLLEEASVELQLPISFALIGGLAVSTWGAVRATQDVDLLANSVPSPIRDWRVRENLKKYLETKLCAVEWRIGDPDDPIPLLLKIELPETLGSVGADILWAHKRWQLEVLKRTIGVEVEGDSLPVVHPEDLILMKLEAGGPQDFLDVQQLLSVAPPQLDLMRLKRIAARLRLGTMLQRCLREVGKKD